MIIVSGRFYIYKGVYYTYLRGKTGPTIYDLDLFYNAKMPKSEKVFRFERNLKNTQLTTDELEHLKQWDTRSFMVLQHDQVIFEEYYEQTQPTTLSNSFSAAKTVVGLLIGCAIDEGKIQSVDESVSKYIPEFKEGGKEIITIRDLLTMASGLSWTESGKNPFSDNAASYYGTYLRDLSVQQKLITEPGKLFLYQSGDTQLLSYVIKKATGKTVSEYATEKIWSKIGTSNDMYWSLDKKDGDEKAFCCIYATTEDFAKLGRLLLHYGTWNGETIISKEYMNEFFAAAPLTTEEGIPNTRYGFQVWRYPIANDVIYYCRGILGQYIVSIPSKDAIFVRTGMKRDDNVTVEESKDDLFKVGHPRDFFEYLEIANRIIDQP